MNDCDYQTNDHDANYSKAKVLEGEQNREWRDIAWKELIDALRKDVPDIDQIVKDASK